MSKFISSLFGGSGVNQAQQQQLQLLQKQQADANAVAAGQQALIKGGGLGTMAFVDNASGSSSGAAMKGLNTLLSGAH